MDILTIGEVLIDLTQTGKDVRGIPQFAANPGGAPANLAVAASRLGAQTAFIGKVGADAFGRYLKEVLAENKVDVSGMAVDADHPTTMAVVSVDATGERDFSFYRSANADVMLCKEDISDEALKAAKIVHFGSVSLTADPSRTATLDAAARAKKLGATITYDPNYRANLWKNKEDAIAQMKTPLPLVDILKVSDEELPLLTGTTDCESGTAQLAQNGIRLIFVTLGANGVFYRFGDKTGHVAGVPCKVGDTNGAGDTFFGAALSKLCKEELDTLNRPGTHLPSHCDMRLTNGVDMTTGSLGQGFSAAVGMALAAQADKRDLNVYTIIGDGESQEGQIWEAALLAGDRKLDNLIAFTDYNKMQIDGYVGDVNTLDPLEDKWKAFGWDVQSVDGHDIQQILYAIDNAKKEKGRPSMIILNTIKGKGVYFAENLVACHNMTITEEMWKKAVDMIDKEEI